MISKGSNSGVYLRGRHEVQIFDSVGKETVGPGDCGAVYGSAVPAANASRAPGQWQSFDVTLVGRRLTVLHNGVCIHNYLDLGEPARPGPILLQGDHGEVRYRNLRIKPLSGDYVTHAKLYVLNNLGDDVTVVDIPSHRVINRIVLGNHHHGIAATAAQNRVFISSEENNRVYVIDPATDKVVQEIAVGPRPNEIEVTPDGRWLYVPCGASDHYDVVDAPRGEIAKRIRTGGHPHNVVCSPDGRFMYLSPLGDVKKIYIVETTNHEVVGTIPLPGQARPLAIGHDGTKLFVECDPFMGFVMAEVPRGKILHEVRIDLTPEEQTVPSRSHGIGVTPSGKEVWVCDVGHKFVAVFDVTTSPPCQIARITTKTQPYWLTFSPDGKYGYVSNAGVDQVQVVEVVTRKTVTWIPTGKSSRRLLAVTTAQF
jgi:YVTN family beta-propeller protein